MSLEKTLQTIENTTGLASYDKRDLVKQAIESNLLNATEKYKIDQMVEHGIYDQEIVTEKERRKNNIIDKLLEILGKSQLRVMYIATLVFIVALFNSSNMWKYLMTELVGK